MRFSDKKFSTYTKKFQFISFIREFFIKAGFQDVLSPPIVQNPGMEAHIHPFKLDQIPLYLHTSPEFHMKELLSLGFDKIFTITYCFRNEPSSPLHRPQFLLLEWYRTHSHYRDMMDDTEKLLEKSYEFFEKKTPKLQRTSIQEIFLEYLKFDILNLLEKEDLKEKIKADFPHIPIGSEELLWEDYFFLLFLNEIEPKLKNIPSLLLYEFPYHLCALSTIKKEDPRVCERFEVFMNGIEICNAFNELRDLKIQKERFITQRDLKTHLYGYELPNPKVLYDALSVGFPESSGNALGIERLFKILSNYENPFWD